MITKALSVFASKGQVWSSSVVVLGRLIEQNKLRELDQFGKKNQGNQQCFSVSENHPKPKSKSSAEVKHSDWKLTVREQGR